MVVIAALKTGILEGRRVETRPRDTLETAEKKNVCNWSPSMSTGTTARSAVAAEAVGGCIHTVRWSTLKVSQID